MVDGLFFCATRTGRRGGHAPFVQAGAETSDTGAEAVKPDPRCSRKGHTRRAGAVELFGFAMQGDFGFLVD